MMLLHMLVLIAFMLMALRVIAGEPTRYLIELSPGIQRWVTEEEKWELGLVWFLICYHAISPLYRHSIADRFPFEFDTERAKIHRYHRRTRYGFNSCPDPRSMG